MFRCNNFWQHFPIWYTLQNLKFKLCTRIFLIICHNLSLQELNISKKCVFASTLVCNGVACAMPSRQPLEQIRLYILSFYCCEHTIFAQYCCCKTIWLFGMRKLQTLFWKQQTSYQSQQSHPIVVDMRRVHRLMVIKFSWEFAWMNRNRRNEQNAKYNVKRLKLVTRYYLLVSYIQLCALLWTLLLGPTTSTRIIWIVNDV